MNITEYIPESLQSTTLWLEDWQWFALIALLVAGYILKAVLSIFLTIILKKVEKRFSNLESSEVFPTLASPGSYFLLATFLKIGGAFLNFAPPYDDYLRIGLNVVQILAVLWIVFRLIDVFAELLASRASKTSTRADDLLVPLLQRFGKVVLFVLGVILVADAFEFNITGLVAGLGIGGLAFALAAKDTVENIFGSITVLLDQPFAVGDYVNLEGVEGTVEQIGLRSTRIRTPQNSLVTVPNSKLISSLVDNLGARRFRRIRMMLGVTYDTPVVKIEAFCEGVRELIRNHPRTRKDFFQVHFYEFADSSLNILLNTYVEESDYSAELREREQLLLDIMRIAELLDIQFAFPSRTLHVAGTPEHPFHSQEEQSSKEELLEKIKAFVAHDK